MRRIRWSNYNSAELYILYFTPLFSMSSLEYLQSLDYQRNYIESLLSYYNITINT